MYLPSPLNVELSVVDGYAIIEQGKQIPKRYGTIVNSMLLVNSYFLGTRNFPLINKTTLHSLSLSPLFFIRIDTGAKS